MDGRIAFLLAVWGMSLMAAILHLSIQWTMMRWSCLAVERVQFFYGKAVATFNVGKTEVALGWFPLGGYLRYNPQEFSRAPILFRVSVLLAGPCVLLGICGMVLGVFPAGHHFAQAFHELASGALHPRERGVELIGNLYRIGGDSFLVFVAVLWTKYAAFHLYPAAGLSGGGVLQQVLDPKAERTWLMLLETGVLLAMYVGFLAWTFAFWRFVMTSDLPIT